jgi:hypothetical protein
MPDEPNKNIEEQLKTWAQKRREEAGAPLELHPATRKLLQDEVARTFAKPAGEPRTGAPWWKVLWPRLAVVGSICALLVIVFGLLLPVASKSKTKSMQLAKQESKIPVAESLRRDAVAQNAPAKSATAGETRVRSGEPVPLRDEAANAPAVSSTPAPTVAAPGQTPAVAGERFFAPEKSKDSLGVKLEAGREAESDVRKNAELAYADKAKETLPPLAQAAPTARGLTADNEQPEVLRQRYGLAPTQPAKSDESAARRARSVSAQHAPVPKTPAAPVAGGKTVVERQVALNQATRGGGGSGGARIGDSSATGGVTALAEQNAANTDALTLALKPSEERTAAVQTVSLGTQVRTASLEQAAAFAYSADERGQLTQRFAQAQNYRRNFNSPPPPNVLNSFQLEQNGPQIRIVDADGSTYEGQIEEPGIELEKRAKFTAEAAVELKKVQADGADQTQWANQNGAANRNFWFRVAGTNRTLNQSVMFAGNLQVADTNAQSTVTVNGVTAGITIAPQSGALPAQNAPLQNQLLLQNTRVQGRAIIGAGNRVEIDATAIAP